MVKTSITEKMRHTRFVNTSGFLYLAVNNLPKPIADSNNIKYIDNFAGITDINDTSITIIAKMRIYDVVSPLARNQRI
jgi:hypothetical protein